MSQLKDEKVKIRGIYVSPCGIEVHQMVYYYHFLKFLENNKVICRHHFFDHENPLMDKYSDLIKFGVLFGEGEYSLIDNKVNFQINGKEKSLFVGAITGGGIEFKINTSDWYILSGLYTYLEPAVQG